MVDRCVCCGAEVPEGRWVCPICEKKSKDDDDDEDLSCDRLLAYLDHSDGLL